MLAAQADVGVNKTKLIVAATDKFEAWLTKTEASQVFFDIAFPKGIRV